jgi:glutathione peroxidase
MGCRGGSWSRLLSFAQFGKQEPDGPDEIQEFIKKQGLEGVAVFAKVDVNGKDAHPLFKWLRETRPMFGSSLLGNDIKWNFGKFLLDKDGQVVESYVPTTPPFEIEADVVKMLGPDPAGDL